MHSHGRGRAPRVSKKFVCLSLLPSMLAALALTPLGLVPAAADTRLIGSVPALTRQSQTLGEMDSSQTLHLSLALPLRNSDQLDQYIAAIYDPNSPSYGQYLTPVQFAAQYGPMQEDYDKAAAFAAAGGLTVTQTYQSRTLLGVTGTVGAIEKTFGIRLMKYQSPGDGRVFYAPDTDPAIPSALSGVITGVIGLDNADPPHRISPPSRDLSHLLDRYILPASPLDSPAPLGLGGPQGPAGGITPSDLKRAYSLNTLPLDGTNQTMALTEFGALQKSDVTAYEDNYGLPHITLQDVPVDNTVYTYVPGQSDDGEEALDCEVLVALAPNANKILIYNGGFSFTDNFAQYADDDVAKTLSVSWIGGDNIQAEQTVLKQIAAQGQSIFCGSGDQGAFNGGSTLSVNNPSSQPFATSVGGTTLNTSNPLGAYSSESVWGGTGGGFDPNWGLPSYQTGVATTANLASTTHRNLPDISADADPNSGYSIFWNGGWGVIGGTSAATPVWAGYTTLVNQQRGRNGMATIGFIGSMRFSVGKWPCLSPV
jgi:subtilase family serine protease